MAIAKKIWNIVSTVLVVLVVLCAVFLMGSRIIGYQCLTVLSGSMEPTYSPGDLVYVKSIDPATLQVGDVITFNRNAEGVKATHRVVEVDVKNKHVYTKGDANESIDAPPVHFNNIYGKVYFSIPKLGYVTNYIQNPPGMYVTIGAGAVLILLVFLPDLIGKKKKQAADNAEVAELLNEKNETAEENERLKEELEKLRAEMAEKTAE